MTDLQDDPAVESRFPSENEGFDAIRRWMAAKVVPEHRGSIWYYFGGLTLFLLLVMIGSGLLLSIYYEPSAAPATATDGTPLAAARVIAPLGYGGRQYDVGEVLTLPLNGGTGEVILPGALKGKVETMKDAITGAAVRPSAAWVSVEERIMRDVEFGAMVRSVHAYSANMLIVAVLLHMFSAFFMRGYRRRRKMMWVTGVVLFLLILGFAFTGYLLPWNRLAYFATRVGVSLPESSLPWIGPGIASLLRGGSDVAGTTLTRMYSAHVIALPLATVAFAGLHLLLLQVFGLRRQKRARRNGGMAVAAMLGGGSVAALVIHPIVTGGFDLASPFILVPLTILPVVAAYLLSAMAESLQPEPNAPKRSAVPFYSNFIYRDLLCWLLAFGVVITLAIARPWSHTGEMGLPVDLTKPIVTPEEIRPEWYFIPAYELLHILPGPAAMLLMLFLGILWLAVPWIDSRKRRDGRTMRDGVGTMSRRKNDER